MDVRIFFGRNDANVEPISKEKNFEKVNNLNLEEKFYEDSKR